MYFVAQGVQNGQYTVELEKEKGAGCHRCCEHEKVSLKQEKSLMLATPTKIMKYLHPFPKTL